MSKDSEKKNSNPLYNSHNIKIDNIKNKKAAIKKLYDEINGINNEADFSSRPSNKEIKQISKNQKKPLGDKRQDIKSHKEMINSQIVKELEFKRIAKIWAIIIFLIISLIIIANLILLLYWNPINLKDKVLIVLIMVTFANLFTIITLIFKYVFSPTKEMLDYNSNFYNHEEE